MWAKLPLLEAFEYIQNLKQRMGSRDFNENANVLMAICVFLLLIYLMFYRILKKLLRSSKTHPVKHRETISHSFEMIFLSTATSFLILYHTYFISQELLKETGKWYPNRKSLLFYQPCDMVKFKIVTFIMSAFHIVTAILDLHSRDVSNAISKLLQAALLLTCYIFGYENYSVVLNINLGLFQMFTELLSLLALHTEKDQLMMFRVFTVFKFASWIYIFLSFLPFQYMIPTLHAKDFNMSLNVCFIAWYISKVWTSPLLHVFYHQLYHLTASDCPGENSLSRCLMLKDTPEFKHNVSLKRAFLEVKLHHQRHQLNKLNLSESAASAKTFQTIKCVMTLKRKLKRIRENQKQDQMQIK